MKKLNFSILQTCNHNRDGSYKTQADRKKILQLFANTLHQLGYRKLEQVGQLKTKHINAYVNALKGQNESCPNLKVSDATIKNRLANLRWLAEKINKRNIIAKDNDFYGVGNRTFVTNKSKATSLSFEQINQIKNGYAKCSAMLQVAFGLRKEESIKFNPYYADLGEKIQLKGSWTKGGKERTIPITNQSQRQVLDYVHQISGKASLIPAHLKYYQQVHVYEYQMKKIGCSRTHGLRHAYAQRRYHEITGLLPPACGGKCSRELTEAEKKLEYAARIQISKELGHEREQITAVYLGR